MGSVAVSAHLHRALLRAGALARDHGSLSSVIHSSVALLLFFALSWPMQACRVASSHGDEFVVELMS
jgi:hypothetical protein